MEGGAPFIEEGALLESLSLLAALCTGDRVSPVGYALVGRVLWPRWYHKRDSVGRAPLIEAPSTNTTLDPDAVALAKEILGGESICEIIHVCKAPPPIHHALCMFSVQSAEHHESHNKRSRLLYRKNSEGMVVKGNGHITDHLVSAVYSASRTTPP